MKDFAEFRDLLADKEVAGKREALTAEVLEACKNEAPEIRAMAAATLVSVFNLEKYHEWINS